MCGILVKKNCTGATPWSQYELRTNFPAIPWPGICHFDFLEYLFQTLHSKNVTQLYWMAGGGCWVSLESISWLRKAQNKRIRPKECPLWDGGSPRPWLYYFPTHTLVNSRIHFFSVVLCNAWSGKHISLRTIVRFGNKSVFFSPHLGPTDWLSLWDPAHRHCSCAGWLVLGR